MSESQERMMAIVAPADVPRFLEICARWDVPATVIGEVTGTGRLEMTWRGEQVVDIPPGSAADDGPVYDRGAERPASQRELAADDPAALPRPASGAELRADAARAARRPRTRPTRPGSPSSTTATCAATPCWPRRRTPA